MPRLLRRLLAPLSLALGLLSPQVSGEAIPFDQCPSQAFLVQSSVARLYGVDLSTGFVESLADNLQTNDKLNGLGFNYADALLYGWSYEYRTLARVGVDYSVEPLTLVNALDDNYFVGDVRVDGSAYFAYKRGTGGSHGLWRIDLDSASPTYLDPVRVIDGQSLSLAIFDFAFHPDNGLLYSVTSAGDLVTIDPDNGTVSFLQRLAERGTFGAVYFDVDGRLYISRNTDGAIFQINVADASPEAVWYAQGPKSSQNDGARCALASVAPRSDSMIDFGDAPDSYGTTLNSNGARHNLEGSQVLLGELVDAEAQAWPSPNSDQSVNLADEDGITFITDIAAEETALIAVESQGAGYLNAWIDFDRDGEFGVDEQILTSHFLDGGSTILPVAIPASISSGSSWARFRVSSQRIVGPTGGVADGEVEDYAVELFGRRVTTTYYPSASGYVTLAYEDLWPSVGDYDLNDLVVFYRTSLNSTVMDNRPGESSIYSIVIEGQVSAVGASLHSGFAVEVPGLPRSAVDQQAMSLVVGGVTKPGNFLEVGAGNENAVFIVFNDVWDVVTPTEGCKFYRTEDSCSGTASQSKFTLTIPVSTEVPSAVIDDLLLNPFIFGTNARRLEVHLKNKPPTVKAGVSSFGTEDDASNPSAGLFYQTSSGLPWAIVIGDTWMHPEESRDIVQSYPGFEPYVTSGGVLGADWYRQENAVPQKLYQEF